MAENDILFTGSIPANYDRYMVPLLFRPYAEQVAQRARILSPKRILETAAGTGIVTQALHEALPDADIVATDLNTPMLEEAERRVGSGKVLFRQADALALPFEDACFDLVVCQFGVMFFPDKVAGNSEAHRVLRDGGSYMLVIWNGVDRNLATKVVGSAVADLFPAQDRSAFYERGRSAIMMRRSFVLIWRRPDSPGSQLRASISAAALRPRAMRRWASFKARRCGPNWRSAGRECSSVPRLRQSKRSVGLRGPTVSTRQCRR